jgi:hypothetical protein
MDTVTIAQIEEQLRQLPQEKLEVVSDFVAFLVRRKPLTAAQAAMLASEKVLARDWDTPEEDEAWAHL